MATDIDRLFAMKAVHKRMGEELKGMEDAAKAQAVADFEAGRGGQVRSPLFGNKAGWITVKEGTPESEERTFHVADYNEARDWFYRLDDPEWFRSYALQDLAGFAEWYLSETGECPDGCTLITARVPGKPPSASLTVKPDVVMPRLMEDAEMRRELFGSGVFLLEGGE